jgi:hypothetical protein
MFPLLDLDLIRKPLMNPDYRLLEHPIGSRRNPNLVDDLDDTEDEKYVVWLSKYLATVKLKPASHQDALCNELCEITPEKAIRKLASDLGTHHAASSPDDANLEAGEPASESEWNRCDWPHRIEMPIDVGYRVVLARILRPLASQAKRVKLLKQFYSVYAQHAEK